MRRTAHYRVPDTSRLGLRCGVLAGALITVLCGCGGPATAPEEELRDWVRRGAAAAEARERRVLAGLLQVYFKRMNTIELVTSIDEINVAADSAAELLVTVGMAGTHDGVFGFSADAYQFLLELEKDGGDWALISARWGPMGGELR
jgi:hypothetical protein